MNASESLSSGWRTPTDDSRRGGASDPERRLAGGHTLNLQDQVLGFSTWPTPAARDFKGVDREEIERKGARPLNEVVAKWATPAAADSTGTNGGNQMKSLRTDVANWSTPRASDGEKGGPNQSFGAGGVPLTAQATNWATPTAQPSNGDAESFLRRKGRKPGGAITDLGAQTKGWSTPSVADTTGDRKTRSGDRSGEMLNNSLAPMVADLVTWPTPTSLSFAGSHQPGNSRSYNETMARANVLLSDLQAPETLPLGASSPPTAPTFYQRYRATTDSALRCEMRALRRLARDRRPTSVLKKNKAGAWEAVRPAGWTPGPASLWIRPSFRRQLNPRFVEWLMSWPPGLTSFDCSETALRTHKEAWRSELASMTSLPKAPPAQLALFG